MPTVFTLFYAIFWGRIASAQVRWKAFDWPLALRGGPHYLPSRRRLYWSLWYLTILPIVLFIPLLLLLTYPEESANSWLRIAGLLISIVAAHSAFAPYRLWLARMESQPNLYYYPTQSEPGYYMLQPWSREHLLLDPQWSRNNRLVASWYIAITALPAVVRFSLTYGVPEVLLVVIIVLILLCASTLD